MNNRECQIKDDDEILEEEKNRFNFRRFTSEEIEKKHSPFEHVKKREFPFLFQKKREVYKEDIKISLDDIITRISDISLNSVNTVLASNQFTHNGMVFEPTTPVFRSVSPDETTLPEIELGESYYSPNTPPYPPFDSETKMNSIEDLKLDDDVVLDG
jgi:hypothetical protein